MAADPQQLARGVRGVVLDVDGVLTDGRLAYGPDGETTKTFDVRDGLGIRLLQQAGIRVAILSSRRSAAVDVRGRELGIDPVLQGRADKRAGLREILSAWNLDATQCAMVGDDWPDLAPFAQVGLAATVADADDAVRAAAHWCARAGGGRGAVREFAHFVLAAQGRLEDLLARARAGGVAPIEPQAGPHA
ncbi:MAG TPA: HAD family hydrolase [Burkholderiaceae bacterium]|nr:HAD family hydrolase [Burkholderiaceae bacterium]